MAQPHKHPLRSLTGTERAELERVARSASDRADRVARAKQLLAVADGARFTDAARQTGRRSGDAVALLVQRFNALGLAALDARHGGGCSTGRPSATASCASFGGPRTASAMGPRPGR